MTRPNTTPSNIKTKRSRRRSAAPRMRVLRDPEVLDLVFQSFESLTSLRQRCAQKIVAAREKELLLGQMLWNEDESGLRRWRRLYDMVKTSWSLLDETVRVNRLDPARFQEAYRQMLWIRTAWARLDSRTESIRLMDHIKDLLRQLLIRYAQGQTPRGWSPR